MSPEAEPICERLRAICLSFDGTMEKLSHGEPAFFVDGKLFTTFDDHHHGSSHVSAWVAAPPGAQETLIDANPARFFRPPYVGHRGWVGIVLDTDPDWDEVAGIVADAANHVRPVRRSRPKAAK